MARQVQTSMGSYFDNRHGDRDCYVGVSLEPQRQKSPGEQELIIMIGLQASGKSTLVRRYLKGTHVWVSKDHFPHRKNRQSLIEKLIAENLDKGLSVVVDNTNPRAEDRAPLIALARKSGARVVGIFLAAPPEDCLRRNALREGKEQVPERGIRATAKVLQSPEWSEGYDQLLRAELLPTGDFKIREWEDE